MRLIDLFNSRLAVGLGLSISSMTPPWVGYPLAHRIAELVASRRKSMMVMAVRANQWVIHDEAITPQKLDLAVRRVFISIGRSLYDFYHFLNHPKAIRRMVEFDPTFDTAFEQARQGRQGSLWVAPHMSNFDLVARAVVLRGLPLQFLTYPSPPGGYRWQNELRELRGARITPMSIEAIRQASETLRANGAVITAVDRPLTKDDAKYRPRFFGRAAAMPVFHIRLAIKHNLPITVLGGCRKLDGRYFVWASEPIPMERRPDLVEETVVNAERILSVIAGYLYKTPDQWAMLYPVWPETINSMPA